jgi:hypothetical protein
VSISARNPAAAPSIGPADRISAHPVGVPVTPSTPDSARLRPRLVHDIRHELGTITMLASLRSGAPDAPGLGSLGLGIVPDMVVEWGGEMEIRRGILAGCCAGLQYPAVARHDPESAQ